MKSLRGVTMSVQSPLFITCDHENFRQVNCKCCGQGTSVVGALEERNAKQAKWEAIHAEGHRIKNMAVTTIHPVNHDRHVNSLLGTMNSEFI